MFIRILFFIFIGIFIACTPQSSKTTEKKTEQTIKIPVFNADSAYTYIQKQVEFGPRVPGTTAHEACGDFFSTFLKATGAQVIEQKAKVKKYDGEFIPIRNIIASFQPGNKNRVLLCAHWDTRPFADHDPDEKNWHTPIDGANDGASGCGVLLEIARQIQEKQPSVGVDIILFDAEDWGAPAFDSNHSGASGYCLGSDYWGRNPHVPGYIAQFGILLDMVSAPNAVFYKEQYSARYAPHILKKVWETGIALGYGSYFVNKNGGHIEDDHVQVIKHLGIPCIDIIHYDPTSGTGFGSYWHTLNDNMDHIDKETLKAVGQTLLQVIYSE